MIDSKKDSWWSNFSYGHHIVAFLIFAGIGVLIGLLAFAVFKSYSNFFQ